MGVHTSMTPLYGYPAEGDRLRLYCTPQPQGKNTTTLLAAMTLEGMGETMAVEGATDRVLFEAYVVEHALAPTLGSGRVVVVDNLSAHKNLLQGEGDYRAEGLRALVYLPSYSPDFNPIEEAFAKIKDILRRAGARSKDSLMDILSEALSAISVRDARGYFEHAGYRLSAQLL
jgi:transposase